MFQLDTGTDGFSYVVNDSDPFLTNSKDPLTCSIVKSASARSWPAPREMLEALLRAAEQRLRVRFKMLAGDFVCDRDQRWHFLQVKAFELRGELHQPPPKEKRAEGGAQQRGNEKEEDEGGRQAYSADDDNVNHIPPASCPGEVNAARSEATS